MATIPPSFIRPSARLHLLLHTLRVLVVRDVVRFWRQRGRLVTTLLGPVVILFVFGAGYGALLHAGVQYRRFLLAGMVFQTIIFSANISAASLIWDREYGFLRVTALAPVPDRYLALGKVLGAGAQALLHALFFLVASPLMGVWMGPLRFLGALGVTFLLAVGVAGMFLSIASRTRTYEDFNAIIIFFTVPLIFLSGAHFPVRELPVWLRTVALYNPATYGVDALKNLFIAAEESSRWTPDFPIQLDLVVLTVFSLVLASAAVLLFRLRES